MLQFMRVFVYVYIIDHVSHLDQPQYSLQEVKVQGITDASDIEVPMNSKYS